MPRWAEPLEVYSSSFVCLSVCHSVCYFSILAYAESQALELAMQVEHDNYYLAFEHVYEALL